MDKKPIINKYMCKTKFLTKSYKTFAKYFGQISFFFLIQL